MYQGEVNVKQAELQQFMSIAESLQIKGLATNTCSHEASRTFKASSNMNSFDARANLQPHFSGSQMEHQRQVTHLAIAASGVEGRRMSRLKRLL